MAPGPGRSADALTSALLVAAMQNTEASVALAGVPVVTAPAATPVSVMVRQVELPKQPAWGAASWPVQNRPTELVVLAGPVVSRYSHRQSSNEGLGSLRALPTRRFVGLIGGRPSSALSPPSRVSVVKAMRRRPRA